MGSRAICIGATSLLSDQAGLTCEAALTCAAATDHIEATLPALPRRQRLQEVGLRPQAIAQLVSQTFNEMIFMHGYVHCDPHAANLFVRVHKGRPQLILLDHGLYRSITDQFRHDYACLWQVGLPMFGPPYARLVAPAACESLQPMCPGGVAYSAY